jgi:hypothetical protein
LISELNAPESSTRALPATEYTTPGQILRRRTRHVINRAATALRLAATTLLRSQSYLGAQYRRLRGKLGGL